MSSPCGGCVHIGETHRGWGVPNKCRSCSRIHGPKYKDHYESKVDVAKRSALVRAIGREPHFGRIVPHPTRRERKIIEKEERN